MAGEDRRWGHRPIWRWLGLGLAILLLGWVAYRMILSAGSIGHWCDGNNGCRSRTCLIETGRNIQYCTRLCTLDSDCPDGWRCLSTPDLGDRTACVKP